MKTIIYNGKVYLENNQFSSAILVENDVVSMVGTDEEILAKADADTNKINAKGNAVVPGFNDSHQHLYSVGKSLQSVQLYGVDSIENVVAISKKFIADNNVPTGEFVTGRGWNQDYFTDESRILTRHDLDKISTEHPIVFNRACGHMATCNTKALEVCGITKETPQIDGSEFYHDEDGTPNGVFTENSISIMLESHYPQPTVEEMAKTIMTAGAYALSQGITSVQTNDINETNFEKMYQAYELAHKQTNANPRAYHQCFFTNPTDFNKFIDAGFKTGVGTQSNKIGPLKMFVDGSLGARTAYLRAPYTDDITTQGISCMLQEQMNEMVQLADRNDCQVAVHAIGDKAIELVLNSYDTVVGDENKNRHGVVHCQITDEVMVDRFKAKDILAYVQPIFIHYDMHIVADRVGKELASTSYAFGDMLRKGIHLSYGTDSPVEDLKTMDNLYCAVARKDLKSNPPEGYYPEQAVSISEAVMLYTEAGAYFSFDEANKGKLQVGYKADLAVLSEDVFNLDIEKLRDVTVELTMVDGEVVYTK